MFRNAANKHSRMRRICSIPGIRCYSPKSGAPSPFYTNQQLELYAAKHANRLSLRQLVFFGRAMNEEKLIKSANYVRTELPVRLAHRIRDLQLLPYVVVTEEHVTKVYELYRSAFEKLRLYPTIKTLEDNDEFCRFLRKILNEHVPVIPMLSLGLSISSPHIPADELDSFMRRMLSSRISRRVLAEHQISLTEGFDKAGRSNNAEDNIGIISTNLSVKQSIDHCMKLLQSEEGMYVIHNASSALPEQESTWPNVVVDGHLDAKFAYIREHIDYIIFELLKNAIRLTTERYQATGAEGEVGEIRATICSDEDDVLVRISDQGGGLMLYDAQSPSDLFSFSHHRSAMHDSRIGALLRITQSGQGLRATVEEQVARWKRDQKLKDETKQQRDHVSVPTEDGTMNRMGLGLPLSNIYATYFGGSLELVSVDGWGTDVYLRLPRLGTNLEGIEV